MTSLLTPYEIFWYFLIYSFIGWCVEVIYHAVVKGRILNRGFLCGPVCPVYGFGMLAICTMSALADIEAMGHAGVLVLFLGGMLLASSIELLAGWLLLKLFHARWWDYRTEPFNLGGFICLRFSLIWGLGTVLMMRVIHPIVSDLSARLIPPRIGWWILAFCYAGWLADTIVTVLSVMGLNKKLKELEELRLSMRAVSDSMSQVLGERSLRDKQRLDETRLQAALARAELRDARDELRNDIREASQDFREEMADARDEYLAARRDLRKEVADAREEYLAARRERIEEARRRAAERAGALRRELVSHRHFGTGRILRGVPELTHADYEDSLLELQKYLMTGNMPETGTVEGSEKVSEKRSEKNTGKGTETGTETGIENKPEMGSEKGTEEDRK